MLHFESRRKRIPPNERNWRHSHQRRLHNLMHHIRHIFSKIRPVPGSLDTSNHFAKAITALLTLFNVGRIKCRRLSSHSAASGGAMVAHPQLHSREKGLIYSELDFKITKSSCSAIVIPNCRPVCYGVQSLKTSTPN
jgi:hypothetical protein